MTAIPASRNRVVIEKTPLVPSQYINLPDHVTVAVQTTDGRHFTQDAYVGNGATDKWDSVAEKGLQLSHRRPGRRQRGLNDDEQGHVLGGRKPIVRSRPSYYVAGELLSVSVKFYSGLNVT